MSTSNFDLEQVQVQHQKRLLTSLTIPQHALPELPESEAFEVYDRIEAAEQELVAPSLVKSDYQLGSAQYADEIHQVHGSAVILTAEHATDHLRSKKDAPGKSPKEADYGTAGLGSVIQEDNGTELIVPRGLQRGDANNDTGLHPLKLRMDQRIKVGDIATHLSLHGARSGLFQSFTDERGIDIHVGVGDSPTNETLDLAEKIRSIAGALGLRAVINGLFIKSDKFNPLIPKIDEDGNLAYNAFRAKSAGTTRYFAQSVAAIYDIPLATAQLELSQFLRYLPKDAEIRKDKVAMVMGVYLGYRVVAEVLQ